METEFIERVLVNGNAVRNISPRIEKPLTDTELSIKQANQLFAAVDTQWLAAQRLMSEIKAGKLGESVHEAAEHLERSWGTIAKAVAAKLRELDS